MFTVRELNHLYYALGSYEERTEAENKIILEIAEERIAEGKEPASLRQECLNRIDKQEQFARDLKTKIRVLQMNAEMLDPNTPLEN